LLAKEMSYKAFLAKGMFEKYISKLCCKSFSLILKRIIKNPKFYLLYANKNPWPFHMVFIESCFNYKNLFVTDLDGCFEF
jgi:hypothetical protein